MKVEFVAWGLIAFQFFWFALVPLTGAWFGYCAFGGMRRNEHIHPVPLAFMSLVSTMVVIAIAEQALWSPAFGLVLATAGGYFCAARRKS